MLISFGRKIFSYGFFCLYLYYKIKTYKTHNMYIKLNANLINLDLIKEVSPLRAYFINREDYENGKHHYASRITKNGENSEEAEIIRLIEQTTTGNSQSYAVVFGFTRQYLNETRKELCLISTDLRSSQKAYEEFVNLLTNNQSQIHEIKF